MRAVRPNSVITATAVSLPGLRHVALDRGQRAVEGAEQTGELAIGGTLVDVGIPTDKAHAPTRGPSGRARQARRRAGGLGEIGARPRDAGRRQLRWGVRPVHAAGLRQRRQADPAFQREGQLGSVWR